MSRPRFVLVMALNAVALAIIIGTAVANPDATHMRLIIDHWQNYATAVLLIVCAFVALVDR